MMRAVDYAKVLVWAVLTTLVVAGLETFVPIRGGGFYISVVEFAAELGALFYLFKNTKNFGVSVFCVVCLRIFFAGLFVGDFFFLVFYYIIKIPFKAWWSSLLTSYFYAASFCAVTCAFFSAMGRSPLKSLRNPIHLGVIVVVFPLALRFTLLPLFEEFQRSGFSVRIVGEALGLISGFGALSAALITILATRSLPWSCFGVGVLILILGDWAMRIETLQGQSIAFGFYEFYWAFGVLLSSMALLAFRSGLSKIESFNKNSLASSYRLGTLGIFFVIISALSISQYGKAEAVRIAAIGISLSVALATLVSQFLVEKVQYFASELGRLLDKKFDETTVFDREFQEIPSELVESFSKVIEKRIQEHQEREAEKNLIEVNRVRSEMADQMVHDIRSPLAALEIIAKSVSHLPDDRRVLLRSVIGRIKDIASNLSNQKTKIVASTTKAHWLAGLLDLLVAEKNEQLRSRPEIVLSCTVDNEARSIFVRGDSSQLKAVISNLINNAAEAIAGPGAIEIRLKQAGENCVLDIVDTGRGIPPEVLAQLGKSKVSHQKEGGQGIGLFTAFQAMESLGGSVDIESKLGEGTRVSLKIPRAAAPEWFQSRLEIRAGTKVICVDDDPTVHQIWRERLKELEGFEGAKDLVSFFDPEKFVHWFEKQRGAREASDPCLILCDHEFGSAALSGVQVIRRLGVENSSYLVTCAFENEALQDLCTQSKIKILPKPLTPVVAISFAPTSISTAAEGLSP